MRRRFPGGSPPGHTKVKLATTLPEPARTRALQSPTPCEALERPRPRGLWGRSFMGVKGAKRDGSFKVEARSPGLAWFGRFTPAHRVRRPGAHLDGRIISQIIVLPVIV